LGNDSALALSTGDIGIGTTTAPEKLSVAGAIITTGAITGHGANRVSISQEAANGAFIQSYGANTSTVGAFTFRQASSDFSVTQIPLAITAAGNVGIGTSAPSDKLSVYTTTDYGNNSEYANATIGLGNQTYPVSIRSYRYAGSYLNGLDLYYNDGTPKLGLRLTSTGNVGIGTSVAAQKLEVSNGAAQFNGGGLDGNLAEAILFGETTYSTVQKNRIRSSISAGTLGNLLHLETGNGTVGAYNDNQLVLRGDGNVGIGTSAPTTRLTVDNSALGTTRAIDIVGNGSTLKGRLGVFSDGVYLSGNYYFDGAQNNDTSGLGQTLIVLQSAAGSASNILFRTSAAGSTTTTVRASIDADGLKFGSDTAAANALDDYEEGTFTPTMAFDGASVGITYLTQAGKYTKVGNKVSFSVVLTLSNKGSSTGNVSIAGLPYNISPATNADFIPITIGAFINITFNTVPACVGIVNTNTVIFDEYISGGAQTALTNADFANDSTIRIAGFYFV
jgi:hypothetical protein